LTSQTSILPINFERLARQPFPADVVTGNQI